MSIATAFTATYIHFLFVQKYSSMNKIEKVLFVAMHDDVCGTALFLRGPNKSKRQICKQTLTLYHPTPNTNVTALLFFLWVQSVSVELGSLHPQQSSLQTIACVPLRIELFSKQIKTKTFVAYILILLHSFVISDAEQQNEVVFQSTISKQITCIFSDVTSHKLPIFNCKRQLARYVYCYLL